MADRLHRARRRGLLRAGVAFVVGMAALVPLHGTAGATTVGGSDPTGDTKPIADCHPDIVSFAGDFTEQTITFRSGLACPSNPTSDPNWTKGKTIVAWAIDTNNDNQLDYLVADVYASGFRAGVFRFSDLSLLCAANAQWDGGSVFGAAFDSSCIGDPSSFRFQAGAAWDETAGQSTCQCPEDYAPDVVLSDPVTRSTTPPPLGYHKACDRTDSAPDAFADAGLAADCLKAWGIALGKADGTFGENDPLLRSQVSSLLARLLTTNGLALSTRRTFPDVNPDTVPNSQVRDEIEHLAGAGIIAGFPDGTFGPAGTLTVAQAATFVIRTLHVLHAQLGAGPALNDQGTTTANYDYAIAQAILDQNAKNVSGATYSSASADATPRGLLADMLAESLEKFGKTYYATCSEAQAAGVAPLHIGDTGYRPALDPDGDGVAC